MGSEAMKSSGRDFDQDKYNTGTDNRKFTDSGLKAGFEDGLSSVERVARGTVPAELQSSGVAMRKVSMEESAGSKNGKSFKFKQ